jgi:hypothetical protein
MAGRTYAAFDQQDIVSAADTILTIEGSATLQADFIYISFSTLTDELDDMIQWTVQRFDTADGTFDALTPTAFNDSDIASQMTVGGNHSAEPTYVAGQVLLDIAVNTRSFQQWYAQPGREFVTAAGANEGIGVAPLHAAGSTGLCTIHYVE